METEQELQDWYEKDKKIKNDYRDKNREEINRKARETYQANKEEKTRRARELYQLKKQKKQE